MSGVISAYATIVVFVLLTLLPLWIPVGVTVAPAIAKRIRRFRRTTAPLSPSAGRGGDAQPVSDR